MEWFLTAPVPGPIVLSVAPTSLLISVVLLFAAGPPIFLALRNIFAPRRRAPQARPLRVAQANPEPRKRAA